VFVHLSRSTERFPPSLLSQYATPQSQMVARMTQGEDWRTGEGSGSGMQGAAGGDGGRFQDPSPAVEGAGARSGKENTRGGEGRHGSHLLGGGSLPGGDETKRMLFNFGSS